MAFTRTYDGSEPVRINKWLGQTGVCSRREAEALIAAGMVTIDGESVTDAGRKIEPGQTLTLNDTGEAALAAGVTILLHKPVGYDTISGRRAAAGLVQPETRWDEDPSGVRLLERHFHRLTPLVPLDAEASGLMVLTQDGRVWRRLTEDGDEIEQEFVVEVSGEIAPYGLRKLNHGLHYNGRALPPCKVSWQNENRLRFAIKGAQGGQLRDMCAQVGLRVVSIRRLRIGQIVLGKGADGAMPPGQWRYLPVGEKF